MRPTPTTRHLVRVAAAARRTGRSALGRGERPAPVTTWRQHPWAGTTAIAGDSLVRRIPARLVPLLPADTLLRGWAGETVPALTGRIDEVLDRRPKALLLQTGTNDLLRGAGPAEVARRYAQLLERCRTHATETHVVVSGIPPITSARVAPDHVRAANDRLRELATTVGATFVDPDPRLLACDGGPALDATTDGVHLTPAAYEVLVTAWSRTLALSGTSSTPISPPPKQHANGPIRGPSHPSRRRSIAT